MRAPIPPESSGSPAQYLARSEGRAGVRQPSAPTPQEILVGKWKDRTGPNCKLFTSSRGNLARIVFFLFYFFYFILEKPATRPRDRCGTEQLLYPFVTGFPGSSRVSALAPNSSGDQVGSTLSTPHAGGDFGLFVGECSSPQTDAPNDDERVRLMSLTPPP